MSIFRCGFPFYVLSVYRSAIMYALYSISQSLLSLFLFNNSNYYSRYQCYILADLTAATALINHFIHNNNNNNYNDQSTTTNESTFHQLLTTAAAAQRNFSSSDDINKDRLEALHILQGICNRLYELDNILQNQHNHTTATPLNSHLERLLLSSNNESSYNSLHIAIVHRNLLCILLLLQHAKNYSNSLLDNEELNGGGVNGQMVHPLQLLHGTSSSESQTDSNNILNSLTQSLDFEQLTPLQLLGKTSISGLSNCRESVSLDALREVWKEQIARSCEYNEGSVGQGNEGPLRNQRRRGNSSSSTSSDEDSNDNTEGNRRLRSGSFNFNEAEVDPRRIRSGSFNILEDNDRDGDGVPDEGGNNDLRPLENVDYSVLGNNNNNDRGGDRSNRRKQKTQEPTTEKDYGCEVLTFGRADNCALGVPQFTTTSYSRGSTNDKITDQDFTSSNNGSNSYKPKRVESFSLGELRRAWGSSNALSSSSSTKAAALDKQQNDVNQVDSPAVSIAASTHHTLVSTRSGQLYSFGYGKGGRLGLGDEHHRPLPTRILGSLTKRIVSSIAAAENHSLCSTSDGKVFAWGSNGFGQLGYSTASSSDESSSRLSPRRIQGELKQVFVVAVAAGARHSVALTQLGEVYCWGDNKVSSMRCNVHMMWTLF